MSPGSSPTAVAPRRIALNATAAVSGGGVTYWLNLLPALAQLGSPHEFHLFLASSQRRFDAAIPAGFHVSRIDFKRPHSLGRLFWDQVSLPGLLNRGKFDVLLAAADMAPLRAPCPVVLAIQNANPYWGPAGSSPAARLRERVMRAITTRTARHAAHVFFISEDSRRRITSAIDLPLAKTSVAYLGVGEGFFASDEGRDGGGAGEYVLSVSAVRNHKDFETLLEAFAGLRTEGAPRLRLLIAGALIDPPYHHALERIAARLEIRDRVEFLGEVPYVHLPGLYRNARLFVLPTLVETFGHPLVEAMASGVGVVATDLAITREMCGDAAEYYPAKDADALRLAMERMLENRAHREALIAAGRHRARDFSWRRCARQTLDLLERAAALADVVAAGPQGGPRKDSGAE